MLDASVTNCERPAIVVSISFMVSKRPTTSVVSGCVKMDKLPVATSRVRPVPANLSSSGD